MKIDRRSLLNTDVPELVHWQDDMPVSVRYIVRSANWRCRTWDGNDGSRGIPAC
jgi:hypothetical protein